MANEDKFKAKRKSLAEKKARNNAIDTYNKDLMLPGGMRNYEFAFNRNMKAADKIATASYMRGDKDWMGAYGRSVEAHNPAYSNRYGKQGMR